MADLEIRDMRHIR